MGSLNNLLSLGEDAKLEQPRTAKCSSPLILTVSVISIGLLMTCLQTFEFIHRNMLQFLQLIMNYKEEIDLHIFYAPMVVVV